MAKVLIFNNFLKDGKKSVLEPMNSVLHDYTSVGPGHWQANPYTRQKHIEVKDLIRRIIACFKLWIRWRKYDVLIADSAITGFFMSALSLLGKGKRKLVIDSFNVPRRRSGFWKWLGRIMYRRVDHFFVHSTNDIDLASRLYHLPERRFSFRPFVRDAPATGEPNDMYLFEDKRPFIMSFGANARDYKTFFEAINGTDLSAIVVAREYNLEGLEVPDNVRTFCNIPLEECDKLVRKCLFTVFTFDGSEPSCGQISIVTSFMLGKPTICTNCTGVHNYIEHEKNGLLVEMGNVKDLRAKMLKLTTDTVLFEKLCQGTQTWAQKNTSAEALGQKIDGFITNLVHRRNEAGALNWT